MNKKRVIDVVLWIMVFMILIMCFSIVAFLKEERSQCLQNAFTYGAREQIKGEVMCSCFVKGDEGFSTFNFNKTSVWIPKDPYKNP